jgi:multidrug resistance protein, MATE family
MSEVASISSALPQPQGLRAELRHILKHGGTVYTGQMAVMLYAVADSIIAGRYQADALAAFSVATAIYASVFVALMGVMQALMPVYAEYHGANQPLEIGKAWRQSYYLLAGLSLFGAVFLLFPQPLLRLAKVPPALQAEVLHYLHVQILALPLSLGFRAFASLSQALARPAMVMWIQLAALPIKVLLSWWLVFGGLGVPALGAAGCAWGSVIAFTAMYGTALWLLKHHNAYAAIKAWAKLEPVDWPAIRRYLRLGIPSGGAMLFEVTSFTLMAVLIARLGTTASAAHQIGVNFAALSFMMPLSLSIASSARVSYWIGAEQHAHAQRVVWLAVKLTVGIACLNALLLGALAGPIAALSTSDLAVRALGATLLLWVAAYTLFDALQTICVFILRSYRVTVAPFIIYALILWGLGLGGGMILTYGPYVTPWNSPEGFWSAGTVALVLTALCFLALLAQTLGRAASSSAQSAS